MSRPWLSAISRRRAELATVHGGARMTFADRKPGSWPDDCMLVDCGHLARMHPFVGKDERIRFFEADHYYEVDGYRYPISCTGFVAAPHDPFLRWKVINGMKEYSRRKWGGGDNQSIADAWEANGNEASRLGTKMHAAIEVFFNTNIASRDKEIRPEMMQFLNFKREILDKRNIQCYRSEPTIFTERNSGIEIAGSVDFLGFDGSEYFIMDWKRAKNSFFEENKFSKQTFCKPPLDAYEQSDLVKYSTQLHTYRYIFQRFYGISIPVKNLFIVSFHADHPNYEFVPAIDLSDKVSDMMGNFQYWLEMYKEKNALIQNDEYEEKMRNHTSN